MYPGGFEDRAWRLINSPVVGSIVEIKMEADNDGAITLAKLPRSPRNYYGRGPTIEKIDLIFEMVDLI